jgi:hypothetical protein
MVTSMLDIVELPETDSRALAEHCVQLEASGRPDDGNLDLSSLENVLRFPKAAINHVRLS